MHLDPARGGRRQVRLRAGLRALAARAHGGDDLAECDLDAGRSQLRVARQCGRVEGVAREPGGVQEEGGQVRAQESGGVLRSVVFLFCVAETRWSPAEIVLT